ncbi:MAG TPA: protein phosphatase 2C domain-containing protein, partial [Actinomycetota bacterium]|nr:protein phosphatase 2C domain-containing protein [Actinomycetota bacterium]
MEVRAASVRGVGHRLNGEPRQDAYAIGLSPCGRYIAMAVADGTTAAPRAEMGAWAAVRAAVSLAGKLASEGNTLILAGREDLFHDVAEAIEVVGAVELDLDGPAVARELATTLVVATVATAPPHDAWIGRIGDSTAMILHEGRWERIFPANDGLISTSVTDTLPGQPQDVQQEVVRVGPGSALVLMSDGISGPLGDGKGDVGDLLAQTWAVPPPALVFVRELDFARSTCDDDRTAVVLWAPSADQAGPRAEGR